jgi:hypothetical protein
VTIHSTEAIPVDDVRLRQVHVSNAPNGGWNVIGTVDGRVVDTRHCEDWHRVERARREMGWKMVTDSPLSAA